MRPAEEADEFVIPSLSLECLLYDPETQYHISIPDTLHLR